MPASGRKSLLLKQQLALQTRCANDIANEYNPEDPPPRDHAICKKWRNDYPRATPRTSVPTYGYNCHGLTFAARRTQVWSSEEVALVLKEDGYQPVVQNDAIPGDIVVYHSKVTGEIEHSGIVVAAAKPGDLRGPLIVSKWGPCEEFIHYFTDCPYLPADVKYYRIHK